MIGAAGFARYYHLLLVVHLGVVFALFLNLHYGKFVYALYRFLALVKYTG